MAFLNNLRSLFFIVIIAFGGTSKSTEMASPRYSNSPAAADFLVSAMREFHLNPDPHLSFSSKAAFTSPDDDIEAGVVREGPELGLADDFEDAIASIVAERVENHGYDHSRHAQLIQSQHKTPPVQPTVHQEQQHLEYLPQPPTEYAQPQEKPSPVYYHHQTYQQPEQHAQTPQQPPAHNDAPHDSVPPPISKEELQALYTAALQKGSQLDLSKLPPSAEGLGEPSVGSMPGYHYYFYPIKQFPKPGDNAGQGGEGDMMNGDGGNGNDMGDSNGGPKTVEPLFVAVSAFIGVSVIFMFSLLFLPKIGFLRSGGIGLLSRLAPDDLTGLTRVVLESVDGKDCDMRIACELGRVLRKFRLHDKPIRLLESFVSKEAKKQLQNVRRAAIYRPKCNLLRCKRRS